MNLGTMEKNAETIYQMVRLRTYPFAVKLIRDASDIPNDAIRPLRDLGYHPDLCQAFTMTRVEGRYVVLRYAELN